ncbi:MAG: 3-dehydroquinate dehydratase [Acholeplasmatales bacterium]|jgi:3-dehydroquinate dehydratase-2|nr:3-dehydroquinate dehydratase [Acholeplasmatales bacterium]
MVKILIINGPNLNALGLRNPLFYGSKTLKELNNSIKKTISANKNVKIKFYQSNSEGNILDRLQKLDYDAVAINPGGLTHTSVCIADCLEMINKIKVEVHLSNIYERAEDFRKINFIKNVVNASFFGKKEQSYIDAINYIIDRINKIENKE